METKKLKRKHSGAEIENDALKHRNIERDKQTDTKTDKTTVA